MKKFVLLFTCAFTIISVFAQTDFQDLSLDKALEKAKVENKLVFVDCYTSWCGPCKIMAEKVLPLKEVGEYMNSRFVCVKVDMEKGEGPKLAQRYQVSAYPTFLVLKTDGNLMLRVVGGTLDGKEFIKKVDAAFDTNSAANMDAEYMAGNRKMDFLLKYTKALVAAGEMARAKAIALDIITSLEDDQKCTEAYWFIYETPGLSPIGSGNVAYLKKHVEQFRKNVGAERVDKRLADMFALQLEGVIRGKDKNVKEENIVAFKEMLDVYKLSGQDYLYGYIDLIKALFSQNTDNVLAACKKVFPQLPDEKIAYLYFSPIMSLRDKWSKKQAQELITLTDQLIEQVQMSQLKISLGSFKTGVLGNI